MKTEVLSIETISIDDLSRPKELIDMLEEMAFEQRAEVYEYLSNAIMQTDAKTAFRVVIDGRMSSYTEVFCYKLQKLTIPEEVLRMDSFLDDCSKYLETKVMLENEGFKPPFKKHKEWGELSVGDTIIFDRSISKRVLVGKPYKITYVGNRFNIDSQDWFCFLNEDGKTHRLKKWPKGYTIRIV